jgi:hypothetical protein
MATEEGSRYRLWVKLDLVLGTEEAGTLMRLLSPAGDWSPPVRRMISGAQSTHFVMSCMPTLSGWARG